MACRQGCRVQVLEPKRDRGKGEKFGPSFLNLKYRIREQQQKISHRCSPQLSCLAASKYLRSGGVRGGAAAPANASGKPYPPEQIEIMTWTILLICSFVPLRPHDFVIICSCSCSFPPRCSLERSRLARPRRARRFPGLYRGGAAPPNPSRFVSGVLGGAFLGPFWFDFGVRICRIRQLLDDYVNLFGGRVGWPP